MYYTLFYSCRPTTLADPAQELGPIERADGQSRKRPAYQRTSLNDKEIIVKLFNEGKTIVKAARIAGVNINTAKNIIQRYKENGGQIVELKCGGSRISKLSPKILTKIENIIEENPSISLQSIAQQIRESENISLSSGTIRNGLFNLRVTLKGLIKHGNLCNPVDSIQQQQTYAMHFIHNAPHNRDTIIFFGETGFNFHIPKKHQTSSETNSKSRGRDVSIFVAMNINGIVCSKILGNYAIHPRFLCEYLQELFINLRNLNIYNAWLVLDSCELHKSQEVHQLAAFSGHTLMFLPPSCTMLNPIHNLFAKIKLSARDILNDEFANDMKFVDIIKLSINSITPADCSDYYCDMTSKLTPLTFPLKTEKN